MITEVPKLRAKHFCRGRLNNWRRQSSLAGWMMRVNAYRELDIYKALESQIKKSKYYAADRHDGFAPVVKFNDDKQVPKAELARVWNAAMADLGDSYDRST